MKKIISAVLIILILATGIFVYMNNEKSREYNRLTVEISEELSTRNIEKTAVERKISDLKSEYNTVMGGEKCCIVLFVDNISKNLIDEAYPVILDHGYKATAVMDGLEIPTDEGCITKNDYDTLIRAGWDFAISTQSLDLSGENSKDTLREYISSYKEKLTGAGITVPETICFAKGQYSEEYADIILDMGFKVVRQYENTDGVFSYGVEPNGLYILKTATICSANTNLKSAMKTANDSGYTYSATVRYITQTDKEEDRYKDCNVSKYDSMLRYIALYCPEADVVTASQLYNSKADIYSQQGAFLTEFNTKMDSFENELTEVNKAIDVLKKSLQELD